jgi:hypothetical protein
LCVMFGSNKKKAIVLFCTDQNLPRACTIFHETNYPAAFIFCIRLSLTFSEGKPYAENKSRRVVCLMEDCAQTSGKAFPGMQGQGLREVFKNNPINTRMLGLTLKVLTNC